MNYVSPYIMGPRNDSQNLLKDSICIDRAEEYLREKKDAGLKGFSLMHVIIGAYVRVISVYPGLNRFIAGQKIFARNNIEVSLTVKQEMSINAPETVIKVELDPAMTPEQIFHKIDASVAEAKDPSKSGFDKTAGISRVSFCAAL